MQRFFTAIFATAVSVVAANAAEIQIGGANGLTASYVTSPGSYAERNYDSRLFQGISATPTYTDSTNGITFSAINDGLGAGGYANNFWDALSGSSPITINVGVAGPQQVWTMLNNVWGAPGANDTTIVFDFFTAGGTAAPLTINLVNAYNNGGTGGQIAASIDCTTSGNTCTNFAGANNSPLAPSTTINGIKVLTGTVFSAPYTSGAGGLYTGSTGHVYLDDQGFNFVGTTYANDYLAAIQIYETDGTSGSSQTAVSAVTVVTPEPSTVFLVLAGFSLVGASRLRRRVS